MHNQCIRGLSVNVNMTAIARRNIALAHAAWTDAGSSKLKSGPLARILVFKPDGKRVPHCRETCSLSLLAAPSSAPRRRRAAARVPEEQQWHSCRGSRLQSSLDRPRRHGWSPYCRGSHSFEADPPTGDRFRVPLRVAAELFGMARQSSASWRVVEYGALALHNIDTVLWLASGAKDAVRLIEGRVTSSRLNQIWALFSSNPVRYSLQR